MLHQCENAHGRAGKPRVRAVGGYMRKLVMICYGVLKNRTPFDPGWASRIALYNARCWLGLLTETPRRVR